MWARDKWVESSWVPRIKTGPRAEARKANTNLCEPEFAYRTSLALEKYRMKMNSKIQSKTNIREFT